MYLIAVCVTSIYVISQELEYHNLGGNNVYDPYDLIASIIGLIITLVIIQHLVSLTYLKPKINQFNK